MKVVTAAFFANKRKKRAKNTTPMGAGLRAELERQMGKVGFAIHQLMTRAKIPAFIGSKPVKLGKEQALSIIFADRLRELTQLYYETGGERGLKAIWSHNANEREAGWFTQILLRAMGMLPGAPDFWFVWDNGGALIELKVDGDLTGNQVYFKLWANAFDAKHAVCRNVNSAIDLLISVGAIKGIPAHSAQDVLVEN